MRKCTLPAGHTPIHREPRTVGTLHSQYWLVRADRLSHTSPHAIGTRSTSRSRHPQYYLNNDRRVERRERIVPSLALLAAVLCEALLTALAPDVAVEVEVEVEVQSARHSHIQTNHKLAFKPHIVRSQEPIMSFPRSTTQHTTSFQRVVRPRFHSEAGNECRD